MLNKCKLCWWQEDNRCYNEDFAMITKGESHQEGELIDEALLFTCERRFGFLSKISKISKKGHEVGKFESYGKF